MRFISFKFPGFLSALHPALIILQSKIQDCVKKVSLPSDATIFDVEGEMYRVGFSFFPFKIFNLKSDFSSLLWSIITSSE